MEFWNQFIYTPLGGFTVVLIGALLLFGEVIVKGRFILGTLGFISLSSYFIAHFQEGVALWMGVTFIIGILLVVLDGKLIGDGTIGGIGVLMMIVSIALPSPDFIYAIIVIGAFILGALGAFLFPRYLPRRQVWSKLALKDTLSSESGYNSLTDEYKGLMEKTGEAITDFRPTGTLRIDGKQYSATSEGRWIKKGSKLKVIQVSGTRVLVEALEEDED